MDGGMDGGRDGDGVMVSVRRRWCAGVGVKGVHSF